MGKKLKPKGSKALRVLLITLIVFVGILELDQSGVDPDTELPGPVYRLWSWFWQTVLAYKTTNIAIGGATVYLLMRHQEIKRSSSICESLFGQTPLNLDLEALEKNARDHGIELNLLDDPRISSQNPPRDPQTQELAPKAEPSEGPTKP